VVWSGLRLDSGGRVAVYAIDPHIDRTTSQSQFPAFARQIKRAGLTDLVRPMISTSATAAPSFSESVELLFIDFWPTECIFRQWHS
jgi:methyltransferase family protein